MHTHVAASIQVSVTRKPFYVRCQRSMAGSGKHETKFTKEESKFSSPPAPIGTGKTFRCANICTLCSTTRSAVSRDYENKVMRVEVPECLMYTNHGVTLMQRLLVDDWSFYHIDVLKGHWLNPTPRGKLKRIERSMGLAKPPIRECTICGLPTRSKCMACHDVYYCSHACQKKHWPHHRLHCNALPSAIDEHACIAVPDYSCFWQYQHAVTTKADSFNYVSVMLMSRTGFAKMYGDEAALLTITSLAVKGKPALYKAKTYAAA
jgi:hypothetical protein